MNKIGLLCLLFVAAYASKATVEYTIEDNVLVLSPKDFGNAMQEFKFVLVYFHANASDASGWLSKNTVYDEFISAAEQALKKFPGLKFAKIDGETHKAYANMYNITELPALKFFTKGKTVPISFDGETTSTSIMDWIKQRVEANVPKLKNLDQLTTVLKDYQHVGLYLGSPTTESFCEFLGATTAFTDIAFISTDEKSIKTEVGAEEDTFVFYRNHTEEVTPMKGSYTVEAFLKFIDAYKYPSLMNFNAEALKRIFTNKKDAIFYLGTAADLQGSSSALQAFGEMSEQFRDKIAFAASAIEDPYGVELGKYLGVTPAELPVVIIVHSTDKMTKYRLDQDITFRNLGYFLLNFYFDNLIPYYKSVPAPLNEYEGDVKTVVSKTYKSIVFDESFDILIEFYSPTCKRCQAFAPIYTSLATKLLDVPNLIVAKIDGSSNDVEGVELSGFPTVLYYPRGQKNSPITYHGDLTEEGLNNFVRGQNSNEM